MKFIITFFISSILLTSLFIGLINAIDPYDKLGNNFFGFETKAVAQSRENKFHMYEASEKAYEAFIIGSSAAHRYPTQTLEELTGFKTFNYAVQHSTPLDYLAIVKHIMSKSAPKLIILQIDFAGMDESYHVDNRLFNSPLYKFLKQTPKPKMLFNNDNFTLEALRDSFRVIYVNLLGEARHIYLEDGNYINETPKNKPIRIRQSKHSSYKFSEERLNILKEIQKICHENKIRLIALISPLSIGHIKGIREVERIKKHHDYYKTELSKVFDEFWDFEDESLKSFSTYLNFHDSTHPTKEFSTIILKRIFTESYPDLGKKIK